MQVLLAELEWGFNTQNNTYVVQGFGQELKCRPQNTKNFSLECRYPSDANATAIINEFQAVGEDVAKTSLPTLTIETEDDLLHIRTSIHETRFMMFQL